jgi:NAD(P)-dependent dehydrogenase (short-subunit alcohol dehydrogenase family)
MPKGSSMVCIASLAGHFCPLSPSLERHIVTSSPDRILQHSELNMDCGSSEAYTISKRANILQVQAATSRWGKRGVRFNSISPGVISTAAGKHEMENAPGAKAMVEISAAQRPGLPDEVANVASFLVGPSSSFITGSDILVDGGAFASRRWAGL